MKNVFAAAIIFGTMMFVSSVYAQETFLSWSTAGIVPTETPELVSCTENPIGDVSLGQVFTKEITITNLFQQDVTFGCQNCSGAPLLTKQSDTVANMSWNSSGFSYDPANVTTGPQGGQHTFAGFVLSVHNNENPGEVLYGSACVRIIISQPGETPTSTQQQLTDEQLQALLQGRYPVPPGYDGPLPDCAFAGTCDDVNDLLQLGINVGKWIFGFLGTAALIMFIYGGFVWVTSGGSAERVKQGRNIVVAAVVGLAIAFGAYVLIDFLLDALSVQEGFRAIQ